MADEAPKSTRPKWVNPCGIDPDLVLSGGGTSGLSMERSTDEELISRILTYVDISESHTRTFRQNFVEHTFRVGYNTHVNQWSHIPGYDWLPSKEHIPKGLHEEVPLDHLSSVEFNAILPRLYEYLQMYAVALEQVVIDQAIYDGRHLNDFKQSEAKLKSLLCEIQVALMEKQVHQNDDVTREIMRQEYRDISEENMRDMRDWLIFRDYMNALEYTQQLLRHLNKK